MKLVFFLFFFVFGVFGVLAKNVPPAPQHSPAGVPPPPGGPIDDHIILLGASAIFYGAYVVYTRRKVSKC